MQGFVQGVDREQTTLFPECLDDWVDESNSFRVVDVFVDALELHDLGFDGVNPAATGRPSSASSRYWWQSGCEELVLLCAPCDPSGRSAWPRG